MTSIRNDIMCEIDLDDHTWSLFQSFSSGDELVSKQTAHTNICAHCSSSRLILDEGSYVCYDCGTVYDRFIDTTAEWRYYGHEDSKTSDPTRCGLPTNDLLPESSLGTIIGNKNGECHEMRLLRKYQMWNSMTYKERTLYNIFDTLTVNAVNNGIPSTIIDEAKALYKKISEQKLSRGDNRSGLIASSIYMSCKTHNVPRSAKEIAKIFNLKTTTMTRGCKKFQEILKMDLQSSTAKDFILRFCSKLNLDKDVKNLCMHVVQKADDMSIICENTPPSIAAGCIYLVTNMCNVKLDKKELAAAVEVSQVTISKCYKKLYNYRMYLFPEEAIKKFNIA
jgi:transcription initiation factor TFIIB